MEKAKETFTDKLINGLKNAATELEELRVQMALGKAEAKDIFEDLKKKFNGKLTELKCEYTKIKSDKNVLPLITAFERLQALLVLGKAESREFFEDQVTKIRKELSAFEAELKKSDLLHFHAAEILLEVEKFKAKLELISLHFQLKKIITESDFQQKKIEFLHKMDEIKQNILEKESEAKEKWSSFKKEIDEAYTHLKKAFVH